VIKVGGEPNRMVLSADQTRLYVANGDLDEIEVIDTTKDVVKSRISVARPGYKYKGSSPNSLALSPDGKRLYVTLGGENAVAVINVATQTTARPHSHGMVSKFGDGQRRRQKVVRGQHEIRTPAPTWNTGPTARASASRRSIRRFSARRRIPPRATNTSWPC
jgi:6-phosphogluconolactonase (cycloisomerase 2 family)